MDLERDGKEFWAMAAHQDPPNPLSSSPAGAPPEWNGVIGLFPTISPC